MPQIWLTYSELATELSCDKTSARERAIARAWDRRRCSDGQTRVKLHPQLASDFLAKHGSAQADTRISELLDMIATLETRLLRPTLELPLNSSDRLVNAGSQVGGRVVA